MSNKNDLRYKCEHLSPTAYTHYWCSFFCIRVASEESYCDCGGYQQKEKVSIAEGFENEKQTKG